MAEEQDNKSSANLNSNSSGIKTNTFQKGLVKDFNETFVGEGLYTHARNAINNTHDGQIGVIGNEPSNLFCYKFPFTVIGAIYLYDDKWAIFTTDDVDSEIGVFDQSECSYKKVVRSKCLNFKRTNLITGAYKQRYDCEDVIYWDDGLNPSRYLNITEVPWKENCNVVNGCNICTPIIDDLNCEKIKIAPAIVTPCIAIEKGKIAGSLPNGSYQVCLAYTINQVRVTDYLGLSEVQPLFEHQGNACSIEIKINQIDKNIFEEFELVVYATINLKTYAKRIGYYSTSQGIIHLDRWDPEFPTVPLELIPVRNEPIERTDFTFQLNNYLLRVGTYSKYKFNYQPQANNIITKWVAVEYPEDFYRKGGNNAGYMRDEQYAFFIRFIHNTGERTESYHIPGRAPNANDLTTVTGNDVFETTQMKKWQVFNTAPTASPLSIPPLPDGGIPIAEGLMGYWESETEFYPDNNNTVWGNLCGQKIRHHKMPDETVDPLLATHRNGGTKIVLLGVKFEGITPPLDENGQPVQSIVGYEILRSSREGNKTILAKGIINNMFEYTIPGNPTVKGLYQNYPYNDNRPDEYLTASSQGPNNGGVTAPSPMTGVKKDFFSFHGPDVTFSNPYLSSNQLKLYTEYTGTSFGRYVIPLKHPRFKISSDFTGVLVGIVQLVDSVTTVGQAVGGAFGGASKAPIIDFSGTEGLPIVFSYGGMEKPDMPSAGAAGGEASGSINMALSQAWSLIQYGVLMAAYIGQVVAITTLQLQLADARAEKLMDVIMYLIPEVQYARQYISYGFYNGAQKGLQANQTRRRIDEANYIFPHIQQFTPSYQVNNINRSQFVALKLNSGLNGTTTTDDSKVVAGNCGCPDPNTTVGRTIASYYGALKIPIPNQYGQLWSIKQIPITSNCLTVISPTSTSITSPILFGGDCYITRFTEKNSMMFFDWWLFGEPDDTKIDYTSYANIPWPRFWVNNEMKKNFGFFGLTKSPSDYRVLDCNDNADASAALTGGGGFFFVKRGFFYLFNSGVRDFFVESEVNCALRDWEDEFGKRHYDPYGYTDIVTMFRSDLIKNANYYKYDYSLSISKLPGSSVTWGNMFDRSYDPQDAASCFKYTPNRLIYSFPSDEDAPSIDRKKQDGWRIYLPNNNKDFETTIASLKPINKTGVLFLMNGQSPVMFTGQEQLNMTDTGTVITVGTGDLFKNTLQNVLRTEDALEYGSCQNRLSVISSLHGVFWVSQNQGKIFLYSQGIDEITRASGLKMWFSKNLPSQLLSSFPEYKHYDNPVVGIGVITSYDNTFELFYVSKKDYKLKNPSAGTYKYDRDEDKFYFNNSVIQLTDTQHFEPINWTASYDPKSKQWVSFHDWIPSFYIPSRLHFSTIKGDSIWKHNIRCDSYCNFYNTDYPFEIEFVSATGQTVNSLRNIEYLLETYKYHNNCYDKFHVLDENFDEAIIYNSEQISGVLKLKVKSKTNPLDVIKQPTINASSIDIFYSKEENKYRFNQFWDITKDRGEFNNINVPMFITDLNGYEYNINPAYVNYNKPILERKKFRHNVNRVFLRKTVSGNNNMLFKISNQKHLNSPR